MPLTALAIFTGVLLPLYAAYLAWSSRKGGRLAGLLKAAGALGLMGFLTLIVRWDVLSTWLVYLWWALVIAAAVAGLLAVGGKRWIEGESGRALFMLALEPIVGIGLFVYAATGLVHAGRAVELTFPLADGRYYVAQGGGNAMLNYHNTYPPQRYALDIVALDAFGRRAAAISPAAFDAYVIYDNPVVAPCTGEVTTVRDGIPESAIGATYIEVPAGNHVVVTCEGLDITLAHMRPGSIAVAAGDTVAAGQPLGRVGNSGNTSEPHLHIHAVPAGTGDDGEGVPLSFGGVFLTRNMTFGP